MYITNKHLIDHISDIYREKFGHTPAHIAHAPGRVNLLGEHVDYNDGLVLPAAIDRATYVAFSPTNARHSTLIAADFDQQASFSAESIPTKTQPDGSQLPEWGLYPAGVMSSLLEENLQALSMNAVFASDVPRGSGLSSSASVEMAFMTAWQTLGGWELPPIKSALLGQKAENDYVGVNCGIMDQFASMCGVENKLLLLGTEAALQANKLAPALVPAAALAARVQAMKGSKRRAVKVLTGAWAVNPHPDLAAAFAALEPDETPEARRRRIDTLIAAAPDHVESKLLSAELARAAEDVPAARKALGDLPTTQPTTRSLALMAAVERGQGAPDAVVRGWLAKALSASHGPQWICGKCNHIHAAWAPVCENCGAFDTLDWKAAPAAEGGGLDASAMLPLIVGKLEEPEPAPDPEPEPEPAPAPKPEPAPPPQARESRSEPGSEARASVPSRPDVVDAEFVEGPSEGPRRR
jgi:hypothetical protein